MPNSVLVLVAFFVVLQIIYYYQYEEVVGVSRWLYGAEKWRNVSDDCVCEGMPNCYPHPVKRNLCGKCFANCHVFRNLSAPRSNKTCFALLASYQEVNKLLVLIASIHRNYPLTSILVYTEDKAEQLRQQMTTIRNVHVISQRDIVLPTNLRPSPVTPFAIHDALLRHENVVWLSVDIELLSAKLDMTAEAFDSPITFIGRDTSKYVVEAGYREYFPTATSFPRRPLGVYFKHSADQIVLWAMRCATDKECWKCVGEKEHVDCTMHIVSRVASDLLPYFEKPLLFKSPLALQSWSAPECGFACTAYVIAITIVCIAFVSFLVIALLKRTPNVSPTAQTK